MTRPRPLRIAPLAVLLGLLPVALRAQEGDTQAAPAAAAAAEPAPQTVELVVPEGAYADHPEAGFDLTSALLGGGPQKTKPFYDFVDLLRGLESSDSGMVLLDLSRPMGFNLAQLAELERAIAELRQHGKRVVAYLEDASRLQYSIASQCDQVLLADMGGVDIGSLAMSATFLRDALDFLGVQMDVVRCGDFKGAVEPYMLSRMSVHLREHMTELLTRMNDDFVRRIAAGRGLDRRKVRELQGQRLFSAKDALVAGLVDRLVPWEGAKAALRQVTGECFAFHVGGEKKKRQSFNLMAMLNHLFDRGDRDEDVEEPSIAVLHLSGPIVDGNEPSPGSIVSGPMVAAIRDLRDNENVRGVVVRINSPGGSATASEAIVLALDDLAQHKPVVCSMGYVAGSGGYYVTCFGRPILAEAGTITGSVGVFGMKPNLGPLMRRIGLHEELISLDDGALFDVVDQPWGDAQKTAIQAQIDGVYDRFLDHVAKSRGMQRSAVEAIAGGRVWSGEQAVANGLVDRIGGLRDAVAMVADEAGLEDGGYELRHVPRPQSFMDVFAQSLMESRVGALTDLLPAGLPAVLLQRLDLQMPLAMLRDALQDAGRPRAWAVMPFEIHVQ